MSIIETAIAWLANRPDVMILAGLLVMAALILVERGRAAE